VTGKASDIMSTGVSVYLFTLSMQILGLGMPAVYYTAEFQLRCCLQPAELIVSVTDICVSSYFFEIITPAGLV